MIFPSKEDIQSPSTRTKKYLTKHYPGFVEYLMNRYSFCESLNEAIYNYLERRESDKRPCCVICGNPVKYYPGQGYMKYCGPKCSANDPDKQEKLKQTLHDKYGVGNPSQISGVIEKRKQTCKDRYGDSNYTNKEKFKQTMIELYGANNPMLVEEMKQKSIDTKSAHTSERKELIQQRYKETCLTRYGMEHYTDQNSRRKTMLKRYGVPVYNNIEQMIQTCIERYGVKRPAQSESVKEKIKQTCINKYGVEYPCLRPEVRISGRDSKPNTDFANLLDSYGIEYEREYPLGRYAYDFKVGNTLIEINPTPTHNATWGAYGDPKPSNYHLLKTQFAKDNGYSCIHVWDWDDIDKVIPLISSKTKIYARKCTLENVSKSECKEFLNTNHIQGSCNGQIVRIGLYYENELVGLMTFGKPRYNKHYEWELLRLCYKKGISIIGGSKKMFAHFLKQYDGDILSYCDLSKFSGNVYSDLGFELLNKPFPSKHWYNIRNNDHITNNMLLQRGFDQLFGTNYGKGYSNEQLMIERGFVEVYDCGQAAYVYKKRRS